jgi:hypothetical protein
VASSDRQFQPLGVASCPARWVLPPSLEIIPKSVYAVFDGSGASGDFLPTLQITSDSGRVISEVPVGSAVTAGDSVPVTWAPFLRGATAGADVDLHTADCSWTGVSLQGAGPSLVLVSGVPRQLGFVTTHCSENPGVAFPVPQATVPTFADASFLFYYTFEIVVVWPSFAGYRSMDVQLTNAGGPVDGWLTPHHVYGSTTPDDDVQVIVGQVGPAFAYQGPFTVVINLQQNSGVNQIMGDASLIAQAVEMSP